MIGVEYSSGYGSLSDPRGSSVIVEAVRWVEGTLLGSVGTIIAVIAVSWIGFMMLFGRANVRHGLTVIGGCFVLFGAPTIAAGLQASIASPSGGRLDYAEVPPPPEAPPAPPTFVPANRDPYAGAALPLQ